MKKIFLISTLALMSVFVSAQEESSDLQGQKETETETDNDESFRFKKENFFLGGGIGGGISNGQTYLSVSPLLGYRFTDRFSAGPRVIYNYYSNSRYDISLHNYGAGFMGRFFPTESFFLQSEIQGIWYDDKIYNENDGNRVFIPSLFGGIGYYSSPILFSVMYDFLWKKQTSDYKSPQAFSFTIGFMF